MYTNIHNKKYISTETSSAEQRITENDKRREKNNDMTKMTKPHRKRMLRINTDTKRKKKYKMRKQLTEKEHNESEYSNRSSFLNLLCMYIHLLDALSIKVKCILSLAKH